MIRRDSSHVTVTAHIARPDATPSTMTVVRDRLSPNRMTSATEAMSRAAATTTDATHRQVAARRRIATPSVRSSRITPTVPADDTLTRDRAR